MTLVGRRIASREGWERGLGSGGLGALLEQVREFS